MKIKGKLISWGVVVPGNKAEIDISAEELARQLEAQGFDVWKEIYDKRNQPKPTCEHEWSEEGLTQDICLRCGEWKEPKPTQESKEKVPEDKENVKGNFRVVEKYNVGVSNIEERELKQVEPEPKPEQIELLTEINCMKGCREGTIIISNKINEIINQLNHLSRRKG